LSSFDASKTLHLTLFIKLSANGAWIWTRSECKNDDGSSHCQRSNSKIRSKHCHQVEQEAWLFSISHHGDWHNRLFATEKQLHGISQHDDLVVETLPDLHFKMTRSARQLILNRSSRLLKDPQVFSTILNHPQPSSST
jgi:hypothetical protein